MRFKDHLIQQFGFTENDWELTEQYFHIVKLTAKEFFLKEGDLSDRIGIVESGTLRAFHYNENRDEITTQFFTTETLVISNPSFSNQLPTRENIVALEPAELLVFTYKNTQEMLSNIPAWREVQIGAAERKIVRQAKRSLELQTMSATERYRAFLKEYPQICRSANVGHIASYLGIDIATLSRIRKEV